MTVPTAATANEIDLTTLSAVKSWLEIDPTNVSADVEIQDVITGFSQYILSELSLPPIGKISQFTETRSGSGTNQMFVRNPPVVSVVSLAINGVGIPAAGTWPSWGYYIADDQKSIYIRAQSNPIGFSYYPQYYPQPSGGFIRGIGNVTLVYTAGYARVPYALEMAARKACAIHYRRKQTLDLASKGQAAGGTTATTRYRDWNIPPECADAFRNFQRLAIV